MIAKVGGRFVSFGAANAKYGPRDRCVVGLYAEYWPDKPRRGRRYYTASAKEFDAHIKHRVDFVHLRQRLPESAIKDYLDGNGDLSRGEQIAMAAVLFRLCGGEDGDLTIGADGKLHPDLLSRARDLIQVALPITEEQRTTSDALRGLHELSGEEVTERRSVAFAGDDWEDITIVLSAVAPGFAWKVWPDGSAVDMEIDCATDWSDIGHAAGRALNGLPPEEPVVRARIIIRADEEGGVIVDEDAYDSGDGGWYER